MSIERLAAALGGLALVGFAAIGAGLTYFVVAFRIGDYCEDAGICTDAAPVRSVALILAGLVGIVCALRAAGMCFRYAADATRPADDVGRWVVYTGIAAIAWIALFGTLRI